MVKGRTAARRRTAIATGLSVAGHALFLVVIALDLDRGETASVPPPIVEIDLSPLRLEPEPEPASPPPAAPPRAPRDTPQSVLSALPAPPAPGPVSPAPAPSPTAPAAENRPTALNTGCIGRRDQELDKRIDCKLEIWSVLDGTPRRELRGNTIPDDKELDWQRVARRQDYRRRGLRPGGNASTIGCPQGNLGAGCLDEMLIPMTGSAAKRKNELPPSGGW